MLVAELTRVETVVGCEVVVNVAYTEQADCSKTDGADGFGAGQHWSEDSIGRYRTACQVVALMKPCAVVCVQ